MGCSCNNKPPIKDDIPETAMNNPNEDNDDKSSKMVIITYNNDEETKKRMKKLKGNMNDSEDDDDIVEYMIDKHGNRIKVVSKRKKGEDKNDDKDNMEGNNLNLDDLSEGELNKMTYNEKVALINERKKKAELRAIKRAEMKKEYEKYKDYLELMEKAALCKITFENSHKILPEFSIQIHKDVINCIIPLVDHKTMLYATCSDDKTIKFWSDDFSLIDEIRTKENPYTIIQHKIIYLISAEFNVIKVYELNGFSLIFILKEHYRLIHSLLSLNNGKIASGGEDQRIHCWDIEDDNNFNDTINDYLNDDIPQKTYHKQPSYFIEHKDTVIKLIEIEPNIIVSSSIDKRTIIWHCLTLNIIIIMNNYFTTVGLFNYFETGFMVGSYDNKIRVYKPNYEFNIVYQGDFYNASHLLLINDDYIGFSNETKTIYIIDKEFKNIDYICKGHTSSITGIINNNESQVFVSSGEDGKVFQWKKPFKKGSS